MAAQVVVTHVNVFQLNLTLQMAAPIGVLNILKF